MKDHLTSEVKWNPRKGGKRRFTQRQAEQIAYRAVARLVLRIQGLHDQKTREDAENALATLLGDAPACPSLALPEGLDFIEQVKADIAKSQLAAEVETRRKVSASNPLAVAAAKGQPADLQGFAILMMRKTHPSQRVPPRFS